MKELLKQKLAELTKQGIITKVDNSQPYIYMANSTRSIPGFAILIKAPVRKFYDVKAEVIIQCDASEKGLGATLLQNKQPVAFVSRSLTKAEQNYAQIKKSASP